MKLGILSDIHEHVRHLEQALQRLSREQVDQIVVLGDVFELGHALDETCRLLTAARSIGVWGNHDFGLCIDPGPESRQRYSVETLQFMGALRPRLSDWGCHFSHVEPWLDPEKLEDLWFFEGPPSQHGRLDRIFEAVPEQVLFAGHYHEWILARPQQIETWCGQTPIRLEGSRYFVVVGALCEGDFATFDTETRELVPLRID